MCNSAKEKVWRRAAGQQLESCHFPKSLQTYTSHIPGKAREIVFMIGELSAFSTEIVMTLSIHCIKGSSRCVGDLRKAIFMHMLMYILLACTPICMHDEMCIGKHFLHTHIGMAEGMPTPYDCLCGASFSCLLA